MGDRRKIGWGGGVNLYADPRALTEDQMALAKNGFPTIEGLLHKRESVQALGSYDRTSSPGTMRAIPVGLFVPDPVTGKDFIMHHQFGSVATPAEALVAINANDTFDINGTDPNWIAFAAPSPGAVYSTFQPASFVNYRGRVLVAGGGNEGFYQYCQLTPGNWSWVKASFAWASTVTGVGGAQGQATTVVPRVLGHARGRMVYANFGPGMGHWLCFGDFNSTTHTNVTNAPLWAIVGSDVLASNGNHLELDEIAGENICAIMEVSLASVSNPLQKALLVLTKEGSAMLCTGAPAQTTDTAFSDAQGYLNDFQASKVNFQCGGTGPGAICRTTYGVFWVSSDDVWCLPYGLPQPIRIGTNIRPALLACPPNLRPFISMTYADSTLYVSVPSPNSANEGDIANNHWRLDLYDGVPQNPLEAQWFGPQDYEHMSSWLSCGNAIVNGGQPSMASSLVTKKNNDRESVVGAVLAQNAAGKYRGFFVTFNQDTRPYDLPFFTVGTGRQWSAQDNIDGITLPVGDIVRPTPMWANGRIYMVTTAGIPDGVEPTWPVTNGGTVVSGGVTFTEITGAPWIRLVNYYAATETRHAITMDLRFKDMDWGSPNRDKIHRRIDINAYFATRAGSIFRMVLNQGQRVGQMGPVTLGDFTVADHLIPAAGDLNTFVTDSGAVNNEFQSKTYRPAQPILGRQGVPYGVFDFGILRARNIQPCFQDLPGIVIDDTNDAIIWGGTNVGGSTITQRIQARIPQGYYENMDTLMTAIITAMNTAQSAAVTIGTITAPIIWSSASAFTAVHPYMTTFKFTFGTRVASPGAPIAVFLHTNDAGIDGSEEEVYLGVTYYPLRCKRLLAILGIDTSSAYKDQWIVVNETWPSGKTILFVGETYIPLSTSPASIYGNEVVPYQRPAAIQIAALEQQAAVVSGLPLTVKTR